MPDISALTDSAVKSDWATGNTVTAAQLNTDATDINTRIANLNDVVADLEKNYSSASEPGDKPNGKIFHDATANVLKWYRSTVLQTLASLGLAQTWSAIQTFSSGIVGNLTGNVTGNVTGTAATVTGAAQTAITSLGTLTALNTDASAKIYTGGETSNSYSSAGSITLNQGAADNEILACKSSDIAHGVTDVAETDTFGSMRKASDTAGGLRIDGISEATRAILTFAVATSEDTGAASTSSDAPNVINTFTKSGTDIAAPSATANILAIQGGGTTRVVVDNGGNVDADGTVSSAAFDIGELRESENGEAIPNGTTVVSAGMGKIRAAAVDDDTDSIIGVISATAGVILNQGLGWQGRYLTDAFGAKILGEDGEPQINPDYIAPTPKIIRNPQYNIEIAQYIPNPDYDASANEFIPNPDFDPNVSKVVFRDGNYFKNPEWHPEAIPNPDWQPAEIENTNWQPAEIENPNYDPEQEFESRAERPEWCVMGMTGMVYVRDECPKNPRWINEGRTSDGVSLWTIR